MVTDEKGDTAGVIINIGRKMVAEVLKWNDLPRPNYTMRDQMST